MSPDQNISPHVISDIYCPECGSNIYQSTEEEDNKPLLCIKCFRNYRQKY